MPGQNSSTICESYPLYKPIAIPGKLCYNTGGDYMKRKLLWTGFTAYTALMLWLLFIRHRGIPVEDYWAQLPGRVNLVPFSSMGSMLRVLWHNRYPAVLWTVVYNIGGNIIMFVPLGFFLRTLFPPLRGFWRCMGAVAAVMTAVELGQLFSLRGFCEVDDLLLNLTGAAIGWLAAKWTKSGA